MEDKHMVTYIYALVRIEMVRARVTRYQREAWAYTKDSLVPYRDHLNSKASFGVYYVIQMYEFSPEHEPFTLYTAEHIDNVYVNKMN
jgi:hypothetical protein